jgi:hypothetical protein
MEIYKTFTAKDEPAYYINRFYYTKFRVNKKNNSIYYKCREKNLENRNCHASVVFDQNDILVPEKYKSEHNHDCLSEIEYNINLALNEIKIMLKNNQNESVLKHYEKKENALRIKF